MEQSSEKSQLEHEQQHLDLGFQSDLSDKPINEDKLITQELDNVVISCKDETLNRDCTEHSIVMDEEHEVQRAIGDELYHLVMEETVNEALQVRSLSEDGEKKYQYVKRFKDETLERHPVEKLRDEGPMEFRVLEEREVDENYVKKVDDHEKVIEHKDDDLKEKHEIEIDDEHGSIEGFCSEYNGEERSDNGEDREFENDEELQNETENGGGGGKGRLRTVLNGARSKKYHYPLRPDAEDCSYYIRTGICKFGSNCKFNHPLKRRNQSPKQKEENSERHGQMECKVIFKRHINNHSRGRISVTPVVEYNFLGLPIRLGEKECAYYMRNGSCKYGPNCRFNHPDPTAIGEGDSPATYANGGSVFDSWSGQRTPGAPNDFIPVMYSPTHNMPLPNPDYNGYPAPAPVYSNSERSLPTPPALVLNNLPCDTNLYSHHQQQQSVISDFPERPGQLECSYFMKTGLCKYKSTCKFHHPKCRIPKTPPSVLSDKGLPLRPDQNICKHYSRYGICKYGPACKYNHPPDQTNSISTGIGLMKEMRL